MGCGGILDCSQLQRSCSYGNLAIKLVRNILVAIQFAIVHASFFQATMLDVTWLKLSCCLYFRLIATTLDPDFFWVRKLRAGTRRASTHLQLLHIKGASGNLEVNFARHRNGATWQGSCHSCVVFFSQKFTSLSLFFLGVWHGRNTPSCLAYSE